MISIRDRIAAALSRADASHEASAEKTSALLTEDYLAARAARGNRDAYLAALAQVPDVEPDPDDRL